MGIGAASVTLANAVIRENVGTALDLGTGCGIQALHLARHAGVVTATDTNPRALALATATARINGQLWELLAGGLFEPVADRRFDLIVSNPPFVIGPGTTEYSYRDSGIPGDTVCRTIIEQIPGHLEPGGTAQLLANWMVCGDDDWRAGVGAWVAGTGCDAWVVQREIADPAEYVGLWLKDAGETGEQATQHAERWLDYFAAHQVRGIGMGLVTLRRTDSRHPDVMLDEIDDAPVTGGEVAALLARREYLRGATDAELLSTRLSLAGDVLLEQRSLPSPSGWATVLRVLRRPGRPGATLQLDEWGQALLAGCTGAVPLSVQVQLLAAAHGLDEAALAAAALPSIRDAITRGLLHPAGPG